MLDQDRRHRQISIYFLFYRNNACEVTQISDISLAIPSHLQGRIAIVTDAGRDAVDADGALTNALEADGKDVWS